MTTPDIPRRLIVAITGASGSIYGVRLLEMLQGTGLETHLIMSRWGARTRPFIPGLPASTKW